MATDAFWTELGFDRTSTGGGCEAYEHIAPGVGYILVTTIDASVPDHLMDAVVVGFYPDSMDDQCAVSFECGSSYEAASLLDRCSADWSIPRGCITA